jgi:hypothetical protein
LRRRKIAGQQAVAELLRHAEGFAGRQGRPAGWGASGKGARPQCAEKITAAEAACGEG